MPTHIDQNSGLVYGSPVFSEEGLTVSKNNLVLQDQGSHFYSAELEDINLQSSLRQRLCCWTEIISRTNKIGMYYNDRMM